MKKNLRQFFVLILLGACFLNFAVFGQTTETRLDLKNLSPQTLQEMQVRNIILMIPDGMGAAHATLGRWYRYWLSGVYRLSFDSLCCGMIKTSCADGMVTDSAAAASAMAAGYKTGKGYVSVYAKNVTMPDGNPVCSEDALAPMATILEAAKGLGKSTGLVFTCQFAHATPAAFSAHYYLRERMDILSEQQVYQNIDVLLGGGRDYLDRAKRPDREDLNKVLRERGYRIITDAKVLQDVSGGKLWGLFAADTMAYNLDRDPAIEPSLAEMTRKAIGILSQNPKGFFLLIEGSQIDWAAHDNDPLATASEMAAFDDAVSTSLEFAEKDGMTAVIVAPDHSTGGLCLDSENCQTVSEEVTALARNTRNTPKKVLGLFTQASSREQIRQILLDSFGVNRLEEAEIDVFEKAKNDPQQLGAVLARLLSKKFCSSWSTTGHSGEDVPLYIYHPRQLRIGGVTHNTDISRYMTALFNTDLPTVTRRLYVAAQTPFTAKGAKLSVDDADFANPVLVISKNRQKLRLPVNKDIAEYDGRIVRLDGVTVCKNLASPQEIRNPANWYVCQKAIDLIK